MLGRKPEYKIRKSKLCSVHKEKCKAAAKLQANNLIFSFTPHLSDIFNWAHEEAILRLTLKRSPFFSPKASSRPAPHWGIWEIAHLFYGPCSTPRQATAAFAIQPKVLLHVQKWALIHSSEVRACVHSGAISWTNCVQASIYILLNANEGSYIYI